MQGLNQERQLIHTRQFVKLICGRGFEVQQCFGATICSLT